MADIESRDNGRVDLARRTVAERLAKTRWARSKARPTSFALFVSSGAAVPRVDSEKLTGGAWCLLNAHRRLVIMEVLMALVLIGAAGFLTYLALDAVRHAK